MCICSKGQTYFGRDNMKTTKFIAIEGGEGSGKSTLIAHLREVFPGLVVTREPGGSPYAEIIRDTALKHPLAVNAPSETMLCLMFASRFDHIANKVKPSLKDGKHVVTDRFDASSFAYNVYAQSNGELQGLFWQMRNALSVTPDLYVFIDVEPEEGLRRVSLRNSANHDSNHFDERKLDFHKKVRMGFQKFFESKQIKSVTINANRSLEEVKKDFIDVFRKELSA